jgi:hypothetical protein
MPIKIILWNNRDAYQGKIDIILSNFNNTNIEISQYPSKDINSFKEYLRITNDPPNAIIHRNEHGLLQLTNDWLQIIKICYDRNIKVMSFDFGYFDHYQNWMVDMYDIRGVSSIYYEWDSISTEVNWSSDIAISMYRDKILKNIEIQLSEDPIDDLIKNEYVVIWTQWTTDLIKNCFYKNGGPIPIDVWAAEIIEKVRAAGLQPVLKLSPVENIKPFMDMHYNIPTYISRIKHGVSLPNARYRKNVNASLIAHAKYHIINCSSVSNELVLSGAQVVATGKSWFDNLGIFYEPKQWTDLMDISPINKLVDF